MTVQPTPFDHLLAPFNGRGRDALLPVLWAVQTEVGHINAAAVRAISHTLRVPEADIYGVIGFYTFFHEQPTGERIIRVCGDPVCALAGGDDVLDTVRGTRNATIERAPCLGLCDHAPAGLVSERGVGEVAYPRATAADLLAGTPQPYITHTGGDMVHLLAGGSLQRAAKAIQTTLSEHPPEAVIGLMTEAGLVGRGGAAFPTGLKWKFTRSAEGEPKVVICNADESEPGTFKDRLLLEEHPALVLAGMVLAAYAVGATHGYVFIRGEYPQAQAAVERAIIGMTDANLLGEGIAGTGFGFRVEVRRGAGAYICGEETALLEAIEGKRGFPRIKPPYPTTHGLFGRPTVVNNVETLAAVPGIITEGVAWFKAVGTEGSSGPKLLSVSGHVARPGVYEIEPGMPLRTLLTEHCGGVVGPLQAVLMGGAAGTFLTPGEIDVPLSFEALREAGSTFGSGAVMVFNTGADLRDVLRGLGHFFQHESCGKCYPCQLGTQRQLEILHRLDAPLPEDARRLRDVGLTMQEASICGLGQTAASAVLSVIDRWPHLFGGAQ